MTPLLQGRILDVVKGSVATATLFLAFFFLPVIGMFPGVFAPAPGVFYALKNGRKTGIALVAATSALLAAVADPAAVVIYLLQAGVMSLALPEFLIRLKGGARSVVYTVAINLVLILAAAAFYGFATDTDLHAKVAQGVEASIAQTATFYEKAGVKGDDLKALQESMHQAGALIVTIYPALVTVALGVMASLNLWLLSRIASRVRLPVYLGEFRNYRNPEPLVWLLIAAGFSMLVPYDLVHLASLNLLIVICALYAVQGLAVIGHFFRKYTVPKFIRIIGCLLLIFQPFMLLAVAVLGIFDLWGDFRSPNKRENL
ncbi:MAG: hypothetical protein A2075_20690 [Geobacteraceae bacterium GWC2_58_44]|nr:MAG: hypothetical protein A2075_20690 [Geobacteraceae bacterium GWC2_58_44]HBG05303.1 DUF2232 domain-containing protein [Geobacter sp.]